VVVVSAMAGETDRLLGLARAASATPVAREVDTLLATGEMVSIALVTMALQALGCPAESLTGPPGGILTDNAHTVGIGRCLTALSPPQNGACDFHRTPLKHLKGSLQNPVGLTIPTCTILFGSFDFASYPLR
jgi:hypothetical protein